MDVDVAAAAWMSDYRGVTYYFWARACKAAFDRDPERHLGRARQTAAAAVTDGPAITMPVDVAIKTRRSISRFKSEPVPRDLLERMLDNSLSRPKIAHTSKGYPFAAGRANGRFLS